MMRSSTLTEHTMWISFLIFALLISACGTLEIRIEGTVQLQDDTPTTTLSTQPALPSKIAFPSGTPLPFPTRTTTPFPSWTPSTKPTSTNPPAPITHFPPGEPATIIQIDMIDATKGWAIARDKETSTDHILTTSDGGQTWRDVTPGELVPQKMDEYQYRHASQFSLDGQHASVIYDTEQYTNPARIWSTSSAGNQWEALTIDTVFQVVEDLTFTDETHGWLMLGVDAAMGFAYIELYHVNPVLQQWDLYIDLDSENDADLNVCCKSGMIFSGSRTGVITFYRGPLGGAFVNWTDDGGLTWETRPLPRPEGYFWELGDTDYGFLCDSHSPNLFSPRSGKVALECQLDIDSPDLISFIFTTLDGGNTWQSELYPGGQILFLNPQVGWALSKDIYQTIDGGRTWTLMSTVKWDGQFSFVSQQLGWAVAQKDEEYALVQTYDGGKIWHLIEPVVVE